MEYKKDIKLNKNQDKTIEKLENKIVFNNNDQYRYVFKKQERLVAGLYLITNLFSDTEPLKWQIRSLSISALSECLNLSRQVPTDRKRIVSNLVSIMTELVSLCQIAHMAEYISPMNHNILHREFSLIFEMLDLMSSNFESTKSVLSSDFFSVPEPMTIKKTDDLSKGHSNLTYQTNSLSTVGSSVSTQEQIKDNVKESRRNIIVSMLKDKENLGVKDFTVAIKDCSEKTIQRELLSMVDSGVLKKKGERRWSVYSLA